MWGGKMIKEYRKIATIKAEQFDGSDKMIEKYGIKTDKEFNIAIMDCHYLLPTLEGRLALYKGDWIATGVDGEYWAIKNDIFKKTYQEVK